MKQFDINQCECGICGAKGYWCPVPEMDQYRCNMCENVTDLRTLMLRWDHQYNRYTTISGTFASQTPSFVSTTLTNQHQFTAQQLYQMEGFQVASTDTPKYVFVIAVTDEDDVVVYEGNIVATGSEAAIRKAIRDLDDELDLDTLKFHTMQLQTRL